MRQLGIEPVTLCLAAEWHTPSSSSPSCTASFRNHGCHAKLGKWRPRKVLTTNTCTFRQEWKTFFPTTLPGCNFGTRLPRHRGPRFCRRTLVWVSWSDTLEQGIRCEKMWTKKCAVAGTRILTLCSYGPVFSRYMTCFSWLPWLLEKAYNPAVKENCRVET